MDTKRTKIQVLIPGFPFFFLLLHLNNKELITLQFNLISIHSYIVIVIDQNLLTLSCKFNGLWLILVITNYKKILIPLR